MKYCLIGKKLSHSYSCDVHCGRGFDYTLKELDEEQLSPFFAAGGYDGFNVTIPYKKNAAALSDVLSREACETGSVNTVKRVNGKLYGYNTDIGGVYYMLKRKGVSFRDKSVLIGGTGGAAQTVFYCAKNGGAKSVRFLSRSGGINYNNYPQLAGDTQIFINATPVGMYPETYVAPVDLAAFKNAEAVFDLIYNPFLTKLLRQAEKLKLVYSNGLSMLAEQALLAEDIWTGGAHKESETEEVIRGIVKRRGNIVLFGMPSAGKTVLGKLVAGFAGRKFIDTDEEIEKVIGRTPAEIIKADGEAKFREIETAVIKTVAKTSGAVIALGGGAPIKEENVDALKSNGVLIRIDRDLSELITDGRPMSQKKGVLALYEERKEAYDRATDVAVKNDRSAEVVAKEILKAYEDTCYKRC